MSDVTSLADALSSSVIDDTVLHERHGPFIELARRLLGVQSNIYGYMEIWPTAFRSYNLMVPNFFNVPFPLLGLRPDAGLLGTAMYASSRAAQCMYCSAHSCTIAQRGGADIETLQQALNPEAAASAGVRAVLQVAAGMSTMPPSLTPVEVEDFYDHYGQQAADWLGHAVAMMGFLNKMMDAMGVDLEAKLVDEIQAVAGASDWTPGRHRVVQDERPFHAATSPKRTLLSMLPFMPFAIRQDGLWTRGVPTNGRKAVALLEELTGYGFPMVGRIRQGRIVRTLTTMLRDNLSPTESRLGVAAKHMAGVVYAIGIGNDELRRGSESMARESGVRDLSRCHDIAAEYLVLEDASFIDAFFRDDEPRFKAVMLLTKAMVPSPSNVTPLVIEAVQDALEPAEIIELVTWLSLLSLLHRLRVLQDASSQV